MTDKQQVLTYLAEVQDFQRAAQKVELTITNYPERDGFGFRVSLQKVYERHAFCLWSEYSEEENLREMQRLRKVYNQLER